MSKDNNDCRIYVGNLPPDVRAKDIEDLFYKFGKINFVDLKNKRGPPFAFVEFDDPRYFHTSKFPSLLSVENSLVLSSLGALRGLDCFDVHGNASCSPAFFFCTLLFRHYTSVSESFGLDHLDDWIPSRKSCD
jgi:hypothetical protein